MELLLSSKVTEKCFKVWQIVNAEALKLHCATIVIVDLATSGLRPRYCLDWRLETSCVGTECSPGAGYIYIRMNLAINREAAINTNLHLTTFTPSLSTNYSRIPVFSYSIP